MPAHTHNTTIAVSGTTSGRSAAHTHSVPLYDSAAWSSNVFAMGRGSGAQVGTGTIPAETADHTHTYSTSGSGTSDSKGSGTAHNNVQPTIAANYIIYAGV
jgi:microcystin-dependent protein